MNHLPTSRATPLRKSILTLLPLAAAGLFASSPAHAEQWTKSDSNAWTNAPSWTDSAPGAPAPPGTAGSTYTDVRINLQGGTTIYSATEGIQTYDVSAAGGETRAWVMSNMGGANSTFTMTGGELIFVQDAANTAVVLSNAAITATINLNGGKMTINETDTNADTVIQIGFGGGGTGIFNINSGGVFTVDRVDLGQVNSALNLNSGGLLVARTIFKGSGSGAAVNFDGGTIRLRGNTSANLIEESITTATINGGGLTVDTAGFNAVVAKALVAGTGSGGLTKNNAGILTLAGNNTYAGTTTVNAGTLQLGNNGTTGSLLAGGTLTLASGTTLALNRSDALAQSTFTGAGSTFQSGLGGDVNFTKAGSGTFTADVANSYTGATTISGGTLLATHASALGAAGGVNQTLNNGTLALSGGITLTGEDITLSAGDGNGFRGVLQSFSGANTFGGNITIATTGIETRIGTQDNASLTLGGNITAAGTGAVTFRLGVNGTVTLNGTASSWAGATAIYGNAGGTVKNGADDALSTGSVLSIGHSSLAFAISYDLNGFDQTVAGLAHLNGTPAGTNTITNTGAADSTLTLDATANQTFSGVIADGATNKIELVKDGAFTQTLTGASSYTGATTINAGTLNAAASGAIGGNSAISVSLGGTLLLSGSSATRIHDSAPVTLDGGTLAFANSVSASSETLGALTLTDGSTLDFGTASGNSLLFAGFGAHTPGGPSLTIMNWSGTPGQLGASGSDDRLIFDGSAAAFTAAFGQSDIIFSGYGSGFAALGFNGDTQFELVPVPEPSSLAMAGLIMAFAVSSRRRRSSSAA